MTIDSVDTKFFKNPSAEKCLYQIGYGGFKFLFSHLKTQNRLHQ